MTNQEAIEFLKNMIDREAIGFVCPKGEGDVSVWQYHVEALQIAISALQEQEVKQEAKHSTESSETQNALDTISRQAAIDVLDVLCQEHRYKIPGKRETYSQYNEAWQDALDRAEGAIGNLPSAQPERKKGEWLPDNNNAYEMRFVCSCCKESEVVPTIGFTKYKPLWDFCPNCGADMRGEKDG